MGLISEMMGISFGQADIYRRALEKMHKPANKAKVDYFEENCVKLAVERGIPKEDAEYIKGMILDNCGYAFNKCISGSEKIKRVKNQYASLTIEEMYKIKNDKEFAKSIGKINLYKKFNREGYGKAYSMQDDGRLRLNDIKDIRYSGVKSVYKIITESGDNIKCTLNHSFPTPSGKKLLLELKIGDELYIDAGYEKQIYKKTGDTATKNIPSKGKRGFRKGEEMDPSETTNGWLFCQIRDEKQKNNCKCELCNNLGQELHHKDGNNRNNVIENFQWLCISCHKKQHYNKLGRVKKDQKGLLTTTSKIVSIEFVGNENVYDVEMANPYHNFAVENGIITGNSHAVCYSYISYYTAYMKVHFPLIFHKTMLNGNLGDFQAFVDLAKGEGVQLLPPHVNYSEFTTEIDFSQDKTLRCGFNIVKGIGADPAADIKANAPYTSINDYLNRSGKRGCNKKCVDALIKVGAWDDLGIEYDRNYFRPDSFEKYGIKEKDGKIFLSRKQLLRWYELYLESKKLSTNQNYEVPSDRIINKFVIQYELQLEKNNTYVIPEPMLSIFGIESIDGLVKSRRKPKGYIKDFVETNFPVPEDCSKPLISNIKEISEIHSTRMDEYIQEIEENEFAFSAHPLDKFKDKIRIFKDVIDGESVVQAGIVTSIERKTTKTNKEYFWVNILTPNETVRVTVWNNQLKRFGACFTVGKLVKVKGVKGYGGMSCEMAQEMENRNR